MTALAKNKSKGTVLAQSVSSVYTALAVLTSIEVTGKKSKTYPSVTLDGPVTETHDPTGYAEAAMIKATGFYDPAHATYTNLEPLILAPVATNFKVTWTDVAPTSEIYSCTGVGVDKKVDMSKAIMADIELQTSGNPS